MAWKSGQSYSSDLRSRVRAGVDGGSAAQTVVRQFPVGVSYIYKALGRRAATGEAEARPQRNQQTLKLSAHHAAIAAEPGPKQPYHATFTVVRPWVCVRHRRTASLR